VAPQLRIRPALAQAALRRFPGIAAGEIDRDIDAAFARQARLAEYGFHRRDDIGLAVIDQVIRADRGQPVELRRARRARHNLRAGELGELHAGGADAAAGAEYQYGLSRRDLSTCHHHAMCRAIGERQRGSRVEIDAVGHCEQLPGRHTDQFGAPAIHGLADHDRAFAQDDGVDENAITHGPVAHTVADAVDRARNVGTDDHRQRNGDARHAAPG